MSPDGSNYIVEAWWIGYMFAHFGVPPSFVPVDPVFEPITEASWVETFGPGLPLEERNDLVQNNALVFGQPPKIVQIAALDTLDDAA